MYLDIADYPRIIDNVELCKRLMSDYKERKAFSYLESGWLGEVKYHSINEESRYCFLGSECRPSQRIDNTPWKAWFFWRNPRGESFVDIVPVLLGKLSNF
ncbi:hypothetical protein HOLleu_03290 [Holothuria leucospilota]|uniref:Uncharacterized protein n=1 Tax=Holothuria leucospilota TaxID=206669 RepID=A0A9Q1HLU2_HOLLE|nr:hypothetical protein HOLleu_03290 [Holothuria leucospilota]